MIVHLLLLTGCRANEMGKLRWHEIEYDGVLRIPGERIKTHRELVLPLPRLALDEMARAPRIVGEPHVFGPRGFNSWFRAKRRLDAACNSPARGSSTICAARPNPGWPRSACPRKSAAAS